MGCSEFQAVRREGLFDPGQAAGFEAGLDILVFPSASVQLLPLALLPTPSISTCKEITSEEKP